MSAAATSCENLALQTSHKNIIYQSFDAAAGSYCSHAGMQKLCAEKLALRLKDSCKPLPEGPLLEIGCGTGFATAHFLELFPDRQCILTDLSPSMLEVCRRKFSTSNQCSFWLCDGEKLTIDGPFALIFSSMTIQWFEQKKTSLRNLFDKLLPEGLLYFSLPLADSFPEWKLACQKSCVDYTANALPTKTEILDIFRDCHVDAATETFTVQFNSAIDFFRNLHNVGAAVNTSGKRLSGGGLRKVCKAFAPINEKVAITYHIGFFKISKKR